MKAFIGMLAAGAASPAFAADMYEPAPEPAPLPVVEAAPVVETGGWYIRGDLGGHWSQFKGADYITYDGNPGDPADPDDDYYLGGEGLLEGKLKGAFSLGGGIGYEINDYLRTDLTADYWFKSKFTGSSGGGATYDTASMSAWLLLANAYVDLGTYGGFKPYVGAGIGGAHIKWGTLNNTPPGTDHGGASGWRFAAAAMVGASYCLTDRAKLDAGYRYTHVSGGKMFGYAEDENGAGVGPGYHRSFGTHEVRAGIRYALGGTSTGCAAPEPVAYEPPSQPIYK